jgi:long-chain fatty acid transport protein
MTRLRVCLLCVLLSFVYASVFAQSNDENLGGFQFSFYNPGARALGMGGAFVGLADDSTAALANPAGLTILTKPEIALEYANTDYRNRTINSGSILYDFSSRDVDSIAAGNEVVITNFRTDLQLKDFPSDINNLSFGSFVYPAGSSGFVFAGFYNEQSNFKRNTEFSGRVTICPASTSNCTTSPVPGLGVAFNPTDNEQRIKIRNYGASFAARPISNLSIGVTVFASNLDFEHGTTRIGGNQTQNVFSLTSEGTSVGFTIGGLFDISKYVSVGSVYSRRAKFDAVATNTTPNIPARFPGANATTMQQTELKIPDSISIGVSFKPNDNIRINADYNRIFYSQLMDNYHSIRFNPDVAAILDRTGDPNRLFDRDFQNGTLETEDGNEYRFGAEYIIRVNGVPRFAIRGGYWHEPFHGIIQTVDDTELTEVHETNGGFLENTRVTPNWFRSVQDQFEPHHGSAGFGVIFSNLSIDAAYDYSKNTRRFVLSGVTRF